MKSTGPSLPDINEIKDKAINPTRHGDSSRIKSTACLSLQMLQRGLRLALPISPRCPSRAIVLAGDVSEFSRTGGDYLRYTNPIAVRFVISSKRDGNYK